MSEGTTKSRQVDRTKSSFFIYPMLNLSQDYRRYFKNAYIRHYEWMDVLEQIYVIFKFDGRLASVEDVKDPYLVLEERLMEHSNYLTHYDIKDGEYVCFVFSCPEEFIKDYYRFIEGKYSKFSKELKMMIHGGAKDSNLYKILTRSEELAESLESNLRVRIDEDAEVFSIPDIEKETFTEEDLDKL